MSKHRTDTEHDLVLFDRRRVRYRARRTDLYAPTAYVAVDPDAWLQELQHYQDLALELQGAIGAQFDALEVKQHLASLDEEIQAVIDPEWLTFQIKAVWASDKERRARYS